MRRRRAGSMPFHAASMSPSSARASAAMTGGLAVVGLALAAARPSSSARGVPDLLGDRPDGGEVARRRDREAGLDDVDAQACELLGDLDLLMRVERDAGRLLTVTQRGVEYDDVAGGDVSDGVVDGACHVVLLSARCGRQCAVAARKSGCRGPAAGALSGGASAVAVWGGSGRRRGVKGGAGATARAARPSPRPQRRPPPAAGRAVGTAGSRCMRAVWPQRRGGRDRTGLSVRCARA